MGDFKDRRGDDITEEQYMKNYFDECEPFSYEEFKNFHDSTEELDWVIKGTKDTAKYKLYEVSVSLSCLYEALGIYKLLEGFSDKMSRIKSKFVN